jgi:hypothetical protein
MQKAALCIIKTWIVNYCNKLVKRTPRGSVEISTCVSWRSSSS